MRPGMPPSPPPPQIDLPPRLGAIPGDSRICLTAYRDNTKIDELLYLGAPLGPPDAVGAVSSSMDDGNRLGTPIRSQIYFFPTDCSPKRPKHTQRRQRSPPARRTPERRHELVLQGTNIESRNSEPTSAAAPYWGLESGATDSWAEIAS